MTGFLKSSSLAQQAQRDLERENLLGFLGTGAELTPQTLAQLLQAETPTAFQDIAAQAQAQTEAQRLSLEQQAEAERLAEESRIAQEQQELRQQLQGEIGRLESELPAGRQRFSEELLSAQDQAFGLGLPRIQEQAQRLGILRGGAPIEASQDLLGQLELQRQQQLANTIRQDQQIIQEAKTLAAQEGRDVTREDIEFLRALRLSDRARAQNLSDLFREQARGLALGQTGQSGQRIEDLFNLQFGVGRQDVLGSQAAAQGLAGQAAQQAFTAREAARQRAFQEEQFKQAQALLEQAAGEQRRASKIGTIGSLLGSGIGAALGAPAGPQGALAGASIGSSIGQGGAGFFGGQGGADLSNAFLNAALLQQQLGGNLSGGGRKSAPTSLGFNNLQNLFALRPASQSPFGNFGGFGA